MRTFSIAELQQLKELLDRRAAEQKEISRNFAEFAAAADQDKISDWLKARRREAQHAASDLLKDH